MQQMHVAELHPGTQSLTKNKNAKHMHVINCATENYV